MTTQLLMGPPVDSNAKSAHMDHFVNGAPKTPHCFRHDEAVRVDPSPQDCFGCVDWFPYSAQTTVIEKRDSL